MRRIFFLSGIIGVILVSCRSQNTPISIPTSLDGTWRMIMVKENASGLTTAKPSSINGDVEITFTAINTTQGIFFGKTPTNTIVQNDYTIGSNQSLTIPNLSMTKVAETSWGKEFVDNIRNSQAYSFEINGRLNIKTANKTLTFQKL